jgi:hypothetical protein
MSAILVMAAATTIAAASEAYQTWIALHASQKRIEALS